MSQQVLRMIRHKRLIHGEESPDRSVKYCTWAGSVPKSYLGLTPPCLCPWIWWSLCYYSDSHNSNILPMCVATCLSSWPLDLVAYQPDRLPTEQPRYKAVCFQSKVRQRSLCKNYWKSSQVGSACYDPASTR